MGRGRDRQGLATRITHLLHKHEGQVVVANPPVIPELGAWKAETADPWSKLGTLPQ